MCIRDRLRGGDAHQSLDAAIKVTVHEVSRTDVDRRAGSRALADLRAVRIAEGVDAGVLQEAAENRTYADVLGQAGNAGLQSAD